MQRWHASVSPRRVGRSVPKGTAPIAPHSTPPGRSDTPARTRHDLWWWSPAYAAAPTWRSRPHHPTGTHIYADRPGKEDTGFGWVTALRSPDIKALVADGTIQPSLFDEQNLGTERRQANLLAVLTLGISDRVRQAEETAAGHGSAAPAAVVALHEVSDGASIDQLRRVVGLTPSGTVRLIDKLSEAGLVGRGPGRDDRCAWPSGKRPRHQPAAGCAGYATSRPAAGAWASVRWPAPPSRHPRRRDRVSDDRKQR